MRRRRARAESDLLDSLLLTAGRGDQAAFAEFYDRTVGLLFPLLQRGLGAKRDRAPEAAEGIYVRLWRSAPQFSPARNCALAVLLSETVDTIGAYRAPVLPA